MNFKVTYDREDDAAYIYLKPIAPGEAVRQIRPVLDIILDLDGTGRLIGVEVLRASALLPQAVLDGAERLAAAAPLLRRPSNPHDTNPGDLVKGDFSTFAPVCPICRSSKALTVSSRRQVLTEHPEFGASPLHIPSFITYIVACSRCEAVGVGSTPLLALQGMAKER